MKNVSPGRYRSSRLLVFYKSRFSKNFNQIYRKEPVSKSLFNKVVKMKPQVRRAIVNLAKFFTAAFFIEHLRLQLPEITICQNAVRIFSCNNAF